MPTPTIPPPPKPRSDLPPPEGTSPADYQEYLGMLAAAPVDAWRDQDGTIYLRRMPAYMAPDVGLIDSPTSIPPDDSQTYGQWEAYVEPEYDFMSPTKVTPVPRTPPQPQQKEVPDAASPDDDTQAG
jgi:hypothetical protein